jgi:hypothetical protein
MQLASALLEIERSIAFPSMSRGGDPTDATSPCAVAARRWHELPGGRQVLFLDDDTIRYWHKLYGEKGLNWLADFGYKGRPDRSPRSRWR